MPSSDLDAISIYNVFLQVIGVTNTLANEGHETGTQHISVYPQIQFPSGINKMLKLKGVESYISFTICT